MRAAVAACQALGQEGNLIYEGQELPDAILACRLALGTLWLRRAPAGGMPLWQPDVLGEEDKAVPHWIICHYR